MLKEAIPKRSVEHVNCGMEIGIGTHFTSTLCGLEDVHHNLGSGLNEAASETRAELRIVLR